MRDLLLYLVDYQNQLSSKPYWYSIHAHSSLIQPNHIAYDWSQLSVAIIILMIIWKWTSEELEKFNDELFTWRKSGCCLHEQLCIVLDQMAQMGHFGYYLLLPSSHWSHIAALLGVFLFADSGVFTNKL